MPFLESVQHEPAPCETLNLEPSFHHPNHFNEYVRVGVVEADSISLQISGYYDRPVTGEFYLGQAHLVDAEIDLLIKALQDAKERMLQIRAAEALIDENEKKESAQSAIDEYLKPKD